MDFHHYGVFDGDRLVAVGALVVHGELAWLGFAASPIPAIGDMIYGAPSPFARRRRPARRVSISTHRKSRHALPPPPSDSLGVSTIGSATRLLRRVETPVDGCLTASAAQKGGRCGTRLPPLLDKPPCGSYTGRSGAERGAARFVDGTLLNSCHHAQFPGNGEVWRDEGVLAGRKRGARDSTRRMRTRGDAHLQKLFLESVED